MPYISIYIYIHIYIYIYNTSRWSRWHVRNYARIVFQGGDHSKKAISFHFHEEANLSHLFWSGGHRNWGLGYVGLNSYEHAPNERWKIYRWKWSSRRNVWLIWVISYKTAIYTYIIVYSYYLIIIYTYIYDKYDIYIYIYLQYVP